MKFCKLLTKPIQGECFSNILEISQYDGNTHRNKFSLINIYHLFLPDYKRILKMAFKSRTKSKIHKYL